MYSLTTPLGTHGHMTYSTLLNTNGNTQPWVLYIAIHVGQSVHETVIVKAHHCVYSAESKVNCNFSIDILPVLYKLLKWFLWNLFTFRGKNMVESVQRGFLIWLLLWNFFCTQKTEIFKSPIFFVVNWSHLNISHLVLMFVSKVPLNYLLEDIQWSVLSLNFWYVFFSCCVD